MRQRLLDGIPLPVALAFAVFVLGLLLVLGVLGTLISLRRTTMPHARHEDADDTPPSRLRDDYDEDGHVRVPHRF